MDVTFLKLNIGFISFRNSLLKTGRSAHYALYSVIKFRKRRMDIFESNKL